ncbi:Hypothetical protein A7982_11209 [Minicystis rosea]|nr:Hypothetical protein A7982_11209 [Minicystis rosea]
MTPYSRLGARLSRTTNAFLRRCAVAPLRFFSPLVATAIVMVSPAPGLAEEGDASARAVLTNGRYRFCHEADYPLTPSERAWCPLVGESSASCPALPQACKQPPADPKALVQKGPRHGAPDPSLPNPKGSDKDDKAGKHDGAEAHPEHPPRPDTHRQPEPEAALNVPDLSGFAKLLLLVTVVGFVFAIVRALARNFMSSGGDEPVEERPPPDKSKKDEAPAPRGPIETDVERLLSRARAAAARGDFGRAIDDVYAALLRRLDGDGLIDIHPSRTNGDYVRALSGRPDLRRAVRDVVRDVERVQFGMSAPSEQIFRAVIDRVVPIVSRALAFALLAIGLGAAVSCKQLEGEDEHVIPAGTSPSGMQAFAEVLEKHKIEVRFRSEPLAKLERPTTLVLVPGVQIDAAGWARLLRWVREQNGRLVLAGVEPPAEIGLKIARSDESGKVRVALGLEATYGGISLAIPPGARIVEADGDEDVDGAMLRRNDSIYGVHRAERGGGSITVLADDRLFTNVALAVPEDALFLTRFFEHLPEPREVEIRDAWTGVGAATPIDSVREARLTPVILQLFVLLALLYAWRGRAFASLRDPPAETRRAFADHARALGLAYRRARASRHVLGLYAVWAMDRLRERVHRSGRQGLVPLAEGIAARTGRSEAEIMRVLVDAGSARDDAAPTSLRPRGGASVSSAAKPARDEVEGDLALLRELEGFLTATGQSRPARRSRNQPS